MHQESTLKKDTLAAMIRAAGNGELPRGWLFLEDGETKLDTGCILLTDSKEEDLEAVAVAPGYPRASLDTDTIEDICHGAAQLVDNPTDDQLLRCFTYYHEHDAFIPSIDAPDPPPIEESRRLMDRQFYDSLGPQRESAPLPKSQMPARRHCAECLL